jgi:putative transcriptional regulator
MLNAKKGRLLISEPSLNDPAFFKSVILIMCHSDEESIGLILNQVTKINLNEILNDIPLSNFPVYIGGPVEKNAIQFIHTLGDLIPNNQEITKGLYWGGDFDKILELISENKILKNQIRFFAGYSGWGEDQLNNEIRENSWITHESNVSLCMQYSNEKLWSDLIKTKQQKYAIWTNMPKDPNLN